MTVPESSLASPNGSDAPVLEFRSVTLSFDRPVLEGVSFVMYAGETRIVLGAAGSGKSVMLKAAMGLLPVDSGQVLLFGQDITKMSEHELFPLRSRVGVLFQEGGLFDSLTVGDNVAYPLENRQTGERLEPEAIEGKVVEALRFVELDQTLEKFPSELSGGMRRRVGIARAVVTEPPLVLYDSPTAGLDPITANTIMALIAKERDSQNTANVIVTHRYQDGRLMADFRYNPEKGRLEHLSKEQPEATRTVFMVMKDGHIVFEGSMADLESSTDPYVDKFVHR